MIFEYYQLQYNRVMGAWPEALDEIDRDDFTGAVKVIERRIKGYQVTPSDKALWPDLMTEMARDLPPESARRNLAWGRYFEVDQYIDYDWFTDQCHHNGIFTINAVALFDFIQQTDYQLPFDDEALTMWKIFHGEDFPRRSRRKAKCRHSNIASD